MSSSKPCAAPDRRVEPALTTFNTGFVPADSVYEILLRVPAKDLCRFRAVCRPWRSLLSDPRFIASHAAYHPGPLIVSSHYIGRRENHGIICDIMDLSGRVVKRVRSTWAQNERVVFAHLDLICIKKCDGGSFRLLNLTDGAVYALPEGLAEGHAKLDTHAYESQIAFGLVASTGEYKVFRVLQNVISIEQCCEVFTLDGGIHSQWRAKDHPTNTLVAHSRLLINGIVYFFSDDDFLLDQDDTLLRIALFDLETEEWRATLRGPKISVDDAVGMHNNQMGYGAKLSMANLSGSLVVVHCFHSSMDLWFLTDFEKGLWVKQHRIHVQINSSVYHKELHIYPLSVLNDGRIVISIGTRGLLRIYNPRTSTFTDVAKIGPRLGIGLYTGNLLSLANGAS